MDPKRKSDEYPLRCVNVRAANQSILWWHFVPKQVELASLSRSLSYVELSLTLPGAKLELARRGYTSVSNDEDWLSSSGALELNTARHLLVRDSILSAT